MSTAWTKRVVYAVGLCLAGAALLLPARFLPPDSVRATEVVQTPIAAPGSDAMVRVRVIGPDGQLTGPVDVAKVVLSDEEWRKRLTPEQYAIVRAKGTERPFCGTLLNNKHLGYYVCVGCGLPLFQSGSKFESGTGWPSFNQPVAKENIEEITDHSLGMKRAEILCARCGAHLGHVFDDGPLPTGLRYCLNSESMRFVADEDVKTITENVPAASSAAKEQPPKAGDHLPAPALDVPLAAGPGEATAVFASGCFWCSEAVFEELKGVHDVTSGYSGGDPAKADYETVCTGTTGHAESIRITYDPSVNTYGQLLRVFFATHNPTTKDQQGPDRGTQYRSAVFYADDKQKEVAEAYIKQLTEAHAFPKPIVTTLEPMKGFYPAEKYHQDFVKNNPTYPYVRMWAAPKLDKLRELFGDQIKPGTSNP